MSMMLSRRAPRPVPPSTKTPQSSGPRCWIASHMQRISRSATGAGPTRPTMPHILGGLAGPGDHHVARREGDQLVEQRPATQEWIDGGVHLVRRPHLVEGFGRHRRGVAVKVLLRRLLPLHGLAMVRV